MSRSGRLPDEAAPNRSRDLAAGARAIAPLMPGSVAFGMAFGALVSTVGLPLWLGVLASTTVMAGAAQIAVVESLRAGAPAIIAITTAVVINARFALYSAALAPVFSAFPRRWRLGLAHLMTDQAAAVILQEQHRWPDPVRRRRFALGAAASFSAVWVVGTALGAALGPVIPAEWQIGFVVPLMFIAVVVPGLRDAPALVAAGMAVAVALLARGLPFGLNVLLGALAGIAIGSAVPERRRTDHAAPEDSDPPGEREVGR